MNRHGDIPLFSDKYYAEQSVFTPESLLREARRQKGLVTAQSPSVCVLDPDGDIVRYLTDASMAERDYTWPGYHTDLFRFRRGQREFGIIGCAVGAPFAVLVAEQLFANGCSLLISLTSAGQVRPLGDPPYFVLIERAVRDEGTSYHYRAPDTFVGVDRAVLSRVLPARERITEPLHLGATWTTDAPFRETESALEAMRRAERPMEQPHPVFFYISIDIGISECLDSGQPV